MSKLTRTINAIFLAFILLDGTIVLSSSSSFMVVGANAVAYYRYDNYNSKDLSHETDDNY